MDENGEVFRYNGGAARGRGMFLVWEIDQEIYPAPSTNHELFSPPNKLKVNPFPFGDGFAFIVYF